MSPVVQLAGGSSHFIPPTPEHVCAKCNAPRPPANLTRLANGERWCPTCLYEKAAWDWTHQVLARPTPAVEAAA